MMTTTASPPAKPPVLAIVGLLMAVFLSAVDATIVGTAMPKVVGAIGGLELYPWAFSGFMLASTVVTPFFGKFADMVGTRRCLFVAIALFVLGSGLCGAATTMLQLVLFRGVQGLGAGGILTLTIIAFGLLFSPESRGRAQGLLSMVWGVSSLVGPLAGGLIVNYVSWRWIFWINLPLGLAALAFLFFSFPKHLAVHRPHRIDWGHAALLVGGLLTVMLALAEMDTAWLWLLPVGILALLAFLYLQLKAPEPLIPLTPFRSRLYSISTTLGFASCLTMFAALSYVPLYVQGVMNKSAPEAGMVLTPMMVSWPLAGALAGFLVNRVGFRTLVVTGACLMTAGFASLTQIEAATPLWQIGAQSALLGAGMGFLTSTTLVAAQVSVRRESIGTASSTLALMRNVGGSLGLNLLGGLQLSVMTAEIARRSAGLPPEQAAMLAHPQALLQQTSAASLPATVDQVMRVSLDASLHTVFAVSAGISLICIAAAIGMPSLTPRRAADLAHAAES